MDTPKSKWPWAVFEKLQNIEKQTRDFLQSCSDDASIFRGVVLDVARVSEVMLQSATESLRVKVEFCEAHPGFRDIDEVVNETVECTLGLAPFGLARRHGYIAREPEIAERLR